MGFARLAGALALGFVFAVSGPLLSLSDPGPAVLAPADGPIVLFDTYVSNAAPILAAGANVLVDYDNGYLLLRIPARVSSSLGEFQGATLLADATSIGFTYSEVSFDTAVGEPPLPVHLAASSDGEYLLQFIGPVRAEWVGELAGMGFSFELPVASYASVVHGPPSAVESARSLPYVHWIGPYRAAYKVTSDLLARAGAIHVFVVGMTTVSPETLAEQIRAVGGEVEQLWTAPSTVVARVSAGELREIVRLPDVLGVQEYFEPQLYDRIAGQIHKYHNAWDSRRSGLPTTLTGRSPGPDLTVYTGDDYFEGAGIMDTGFDEGDPNDGALDFFDSPNGDRVVRIFDRTGGGTPDGECGSAHGSHVAGIIAGDGYSWERYLIENVGDASVSVTDKEWHKSEAGVAPEAKISLDGVQRGNFPFCQPGLNPSPAFWDCQYLNGYITVTITAGVSQTVCGVPWTDGADITAHNTAIDAGSRTYFAVHSNSWGSSTGNYNPTAGAADLRMDQASERLVVFAAGNDGPDLNSISGEAMMKNGLAIGASQNFRPEQFESDNPNLIAGFSSRGGPSRGGGRIKPDLVAIGTSVVSLFSRGETISSGYQPGGADLIPAVDKYCSATKNYCAGGDGISDYRYLQGTSMAAPHATGSALLVREYLREILAGNNPASPFFNPPSYLVKAILINGAVRMDPNLYEYPGYDQGWGRIDLEQSLFPPVPRHNQFAIGEFATTGTWSPTGMNLDITGAGAPLKVTLVWVDRSGEQGNPCPACVYRNLDLRVLSPGGAEYHGNQYTTGWSDPVKTGYDIYNTVEQVEVEVPEVGTWTVEVRGVSIPELTKFALVFSGDIGPTAQYRIDLSTTYPTSVTLAPSGSATIPLTVLNYGTNADIVDLASTAPSDLLVTYYPSNAIPLESRESQDVLAIITAGPAISCGIYEFDLQARSRNDPTTPPASDFVPARAEVLCNGVPFPYSVTNGTVDELDPSVVVFEDPVLSPSAHIFIAYRKTSQVSADGRTGGVNVWVAHTSLDGNGDPVLPFTHTQVSNLNDDPNDLRLLRLHAGNFKNRVVLTWTGDDPDETNPDAFSWSRIAYLDPPYTGTWTLRTIQKNEGTASPCNIARVSFPLFRAAPAIDPDGQLIYVWETLAYGGGCSGNPTAVVSSAKISLDAGNTWGARTPLFPPPGNNNFYFFPNGVVDQNDVVWVFVYWRTPAGNDRDLTVRLFDDAGWSTFPRSDYTILDTTDNAQWPAAVSTTEGPAGNRVYFVLTRDSLGTDLRLNLGFTDKDYTSSSLPADFRDPGASSCGPGCLLSADFSMPTGSNLKGPYGTSVSDANFDRRPILNIVTTTDGNVWLPYIENANAFGAPNLHTLYSGDGYDTPPFLCVLTSDSFAKGHQMTSTLTIGGTPRVYEVYHSSHGTVTQVNYEVNLLVYTAPCGAGTDSLGPLSSSLAGTPNPVNKSATFRMTANVHDVTTGNSDIQAAEYSIDTLAPAGFGIPMAAVDVFDSPAEAVFVDIDAGTLGWDEAECHTIFVRGQDVLGNWGPASSYEQCTDAGALDLIPPSAPVLTGAALSGGFANVDVIWSQAADELAPGGTVAYRVYKATGLGGAFGFITEIPADGSSSYTWTDVGAGDPNPDNYLYRVRTVDAAGNEAQSVARAAKYTRTVTSGWQLLSLPVVPMDAQLTTVLQTVAWTNARTYVAGDPYPWKSNFADNPYKDFTTIDMRMGVWVFVTAADRYTVAGLMPSGVTITLQPGWNLVGFPTLRSTVYTVGDLKSAVPAVTQVEGWSASPVYYQRRLVDSDPLEPAFGYWIYNGSPNAVNWAVP